MLTLRLCKAPVVTGPPVTKQLEYLHYVRVIKTVLFKNSGPFF